jgi:hypothetical protein
MSQKRTIEPKTNHKTEPQRTIFRKSKYQCDYCDYITFKKANYTRHMASKKHLKNKVEYSFYESNVDEEESNANPEESNANPEKEKFLREVINTQQQQIQTLIDVVKEIKSTSSTTNNTNCNNTINNNNTISVTVYLHRDCKNALNIKDFVDSINVKIEDMIIGDHQVIKENIVPNLFMNDLNKLSNEERPVHCADAKRGKFFVKNKDEWTEINKKDNLNSLDQHICTLKHKVYGAAIDAELAGIINNKKKTKNKGRM